VAYDNDNTDGASVKLPAAVERLARIMATLRDSEQGCPWDREQTWRTLVPHTIEEAYEVGDAAERGDTSGLCDELGDLLFQVVFYAQIADETGRFSLAEVASSICDKLVRRHPHVFGEANEPNASSQAQSWEAIKAAEREARGSASALDDVPAALPALTRADKLQRRAARVGFDWPDLAPVLAKVREEIGEVESALEAGDREAASSEVGDVLFAVTNLARHLRADPEQRLRDTSAKFERRFRAFEAALRAEGIEPEQADFEVLEAAYQRAKASEDR
jgi:MazG family protein